MMFFALAVDGLGTFVYMTVEIIKGMRYFMLLIIILFISFGASFVSGGRVLSGSAIYYTL